MKRYDLVTNYRCGASIEEMEPADDGEWVRFEDIPASPLSEIERRLLEALKDKWRDQANALKSGPSRGATRDYEDALAADEIMVCVNELDALLKAHAEAPQMEKA